MVGMDPLVADRGREGHFGSAGNARAGWPLAGELTVTSSRELGTEINLVVPGETISRKLIFDRDLSREN